MKRLLLELVFMFLIIVGAELYAKHRVVSLICLGIGAGGISSVAERFTKNPP
jgi:hypothetical protein